jgi:uracil-DNA glycosylase family 4
MSVDGGFGDLYNPADVELNLNEFKEKLLSISPLFLQDSREAPFDYLELKNKGRKSCLCKRWNPELLPMLPVGNKDSKVVFITSSPTEEDYTAGSMFSSQYYGGEVFQGYLELMRLSREYIYLTSAMFCRNIQTVDAHESLRACLVFKKDEMKKLTQAKYFITFGSSAFQMMSGIFGSATNFLGTFFRFQFFGREAFLIPFPHPAYSRNLGPVNDRAMEMMAKLGQPILKEVSADGKESGS